MSLINQMLSDLEARRGGSLPNGARALDGLQAAGGIGVSARGDARPAPRLLLGVLLGVAVTALTWNGVGPAGWRWQAAYVPPAPAGAVPPPAAAAPRAGAVDAAAAELVAYAFPAFEETLVLDEPQPEPRVAEMPPAAPTAAAGEAVTSAPAVATESFAAEVLDDESADAATIERPGSIAKANVVTPPGEVEFAELARRLARERGPAVVAALEAFVTRFPEHVAGRVALATEVLRGGDGARARVVLSEGLQRVPAEYRYALLLAHVEMDAGQLAAARDVLGRVVPPPAQLAEHLAFVAALEQRLGAHDEAVAAYRGALEREPARGAWWVGLGISLAARGEAGEAALAFTRALGDRGLSQRLRDYAGREAARLGAST
jgi:tetratricopeptide (TPR) repeat protein